MDQFSRSTRIGETHMSKLSYRQKKEWFQLIVQRDGHRCLYCTSPFTDTNPSEYEHLNSNEKDNRPENLCLAHHSCNVKKKYNPDMQILANTKLQENERSTFACEKTLADTGTTKEMTSQQEINKTNMRITEQFVLEHTVNQEELVLRDAVNAIVDICQKNNHTGSQAAAYRYIDSLTNPFTGRYTLSANPKGKTIIQKRTEN
jgi:hypothetical protein